MDFVAEFDAALEQAVHSGISEDVLARAFAAAHGATLRFCHTRGKWLEWDGAIWRVDECRRAFDYARRICRAHGKGSRFHKATVAAGVERFASADPWLAKCASHWDQDPMLLGTPTGTVDLMTGDVRVPDPEFMITRSTTVAPAPGEPERWLAFLREATGGDEDVVEFLQRVMGYCLTGLTHEHALFFVHGPGGNGKGVFLNTFTRILGTYAETAMMETFIASRTDHHPTDLAQLAGARLVTASETEQGRSWAESRIKQMTGGDPITARFMRKDPFTYKPPFKIVIIGNHEPMLRNVDEAMRRRFNIIRFWNKPAKIDPLLEKTLEGEHPQILQWMIDGCLVWQRAGLQRPEAVTVSTALYFEEQDVLGQWIEACCELGAMHFAPTGQLYESYEKFAHDAGEYPLKQKGFGSAIALRPGIRQHRSCGQRGYLGLRLRSSEPSPSKTPSDPDDEEELIRP
jgi:putative DNA primase/helicase